MKSHLNIIIENLNASKYAELTIEFLSSMTNESERGAVLIGATKVEEYLTKLLLKIFPLSNNEYKSKLLCYPGPLSSFSGKIELLYAFRFIDKRLYNSLDTLRKIRNEAAHSSNSFSIQNIQKKLDIIYNFEEGFSDTAHKIAFKNLLDWKKYKLKLNLEKGDLKDLNYEELWEKHVPNPEKNETIMNHLTIWKFSYGLVFLCLKIEAVTLDIPNN